jgi:hypothetical protein
MRRAQIEFRRYGGCFPRSPQSLRLRDHEPKDMTMNDFHQRRTAAERVLYAGVLVATACAVGLTAQEPGAPPVVSRPAHDYTSTTQLLGAPVYLQASPQAVADASSKGENANRTKATVSEWLIDSKDGTLTHAVVSIGGFIGIGDKVVLVPVRDLTWNEAEKRYELGWTKDQLMARPKFDLDAATKSGLDKACCEDPKNETAPAAAKREPLGNTGFVPATTRLCKASEFAALKVHAGATEWGKVRDLIVDRKQHRVVLAVVNHGAKLGVGGTDYLIRFTDLQTCEDKDGKRLLCAPERSPEQMAANVHYEKPKTGVVDPNAAEAALSGRS